MSTSQGTAMPPVHTPLHPTAIPGVVMMPLVRHEDQRGAFLKFFHKEQFIAAGLRHDWAEEFCSWSEPRVVRGLHFQLPPYALDKVVCCLSGKVLDVVVDLRRGSPTEGRTAEIELDGRDPVLLHLPKGCAHGFAVLGEQPALMLYLVTEAHVPSCDTGIHWTSASASWPCDNPILSPRDATLPLMSNFQSPFIFKSP